MKTRALTLGLMILGAAAPALAQNTLETSQEEYNPDGAAMGAQDDASTEAPPPPTAAPNGTPPPPTNVPPPPNSDGQSYQQQPQQQAPMQGGAPQGQYVYTQQYGWVYAPYEQNYTYVDPNASAAQMYIYRPSIGWGWYVAPWVLGVGARPYWGAWGPNRYSWYAHPWFHTGVYGGGRYYGPRWGGAHYNVYAPRRSWSAGPAHAYSHGAWGGGGGYRGGGGYHGGGGGHRR